MSDNYDAKAGLILDGKADMLDDGKIVMIAAKRFNEDFWTAYSKQIAKPVKRPNFNGVTVKGECPVCGNLLFAMPNTVSYCRSCGQKVMFSKTEEEYDD